ncbi:peptidyl-prolyl cis-trans isomerase D [Palleronia marisminoris]|uniref:Parvulin-like PPIase n=1 Tax=Palleronia marisminoris TaxID=315423 RepID=A0A1Y5TBP2_9RHOB|nr:SurA N-terminal domain-containing protein [Palleronia marisminoris]SFH34167.1 peptidyl-prolyl cis-trans isomerase D [Palleronia marisminoris]SLN60136.1 Peptidyl-prolyl cis-trans isomerase D [Palleronia marisminoris]
MAKKKNPIAKGLVWFVLLLLIVGLAGFGATSFGGSTQNVGEVGDTEIGIDRYARALQQEIRGFEQQTGQNLTITEAREFGLDQIVLQRLIATAALEDEADELGLSVGDTEVAESIQDIQAFQGMDGNFDAEAYRFALEQSGLTVTEFESQLRDETARSILQGAVIAGIQPPAAFVDALYQYARETRDLTLVRFAEPTQPVPEPTEDDLRAYHAANEDTYTLPRRKEITYAWVTPEMMAGEVEVGEDAVRALYDERSAQYNQPERRLVERLVFADEAAAQEALAAIEAGDTTFGDLVDQRGLTLSDVDLGEVARDDLGAASEAVFALQEPGIVGPAPTPLGPALFRVNAILSAQETPFEEVAAELQAEASLSAARRALESEIEPAEDLLAGGATLEELAEETPFELNETVWSPGDASEDGASIDAYDTFREAAEQTEPGDFPEIGQLSDGSLFALRVDEVLDPSVQPFAEVREQVRADWEAAARRDQLVAQAEAALETLQNSAAVSLDTLGGEVMRRADVTRDAVIEFAPEDFVETAFALDERAATVVPTTDGAILVRVDSVNAPDAVEGDEARAGLRQAVGQGVAQDLTSSFTSAIEAQKGIALNQSAINAVLSQFN